MERLDLTVEMLSFVVSLVVLLALAVHPALKTVSRLPGWRLLLAAGFCYSLGQFADFTDRFEAMSVLVIFGPTPGEVFVEGFVGSVMTLIFLALGLSRWLPALVAQEREARTQFRVLAGLLPICASCKRIEDGSGEWEQLESYIDQHSEARFSHSVCPTCAEAMYGEFLKD